MMKTKLFTICFALSLASLTTIPTAHAGLQDKMDKAFNEMSNVSQPGVFETQRRGVLTGGSAYVRSPVVNTELVNLQVPSIKAGCGGIDFFGGSFSFINADQFVQLLRAVAANAKGYAFQVALDIACPDCMTWINNLQSKIQKLNEQLGNSCQLAQGIVNDTAKALGKEREEGYSAIGAVSGIYDDWFGTKGSDGRDTYEEVEKKQPEKAKEIVGNIVWQELKKNGVKKWIEDSGDEDFEYGLIMAVSGSIIIPAAEKDANNPDTGSSNNPIFLPPKIRFADLLNGGDLEIYNCSKNDPECLKPTTQTIKVKGMTSRIRETLEGANGSVGIIQKFSQTKDNAFTVKESNVMANMPSGFGAIVRNLSTAAPDVANGRTNDFAYAIAMDWAYSLIKENLEAVRQAIQTSTKPETKMLLGQIAARRDDLDRDYEQYVKLHPTVAQIMSQYNDVQKNIWKLKFEVENNARSATSGDS